MSRAMDRTYWHSDSIDKGYPTDDRREIRWRVEHDDPEANLVSSALADGTHAPALDLDLPCVLIPSTTPGHHHLLIDKSMPWWRYRILLRALVFAGLVEKRYYKHSVRRGMTMLRLPHIRKGGRRLRPEPFDLDPPIK